jgi:hypothetical protein
MVSEISGVGSDSSTWQNFTDVDVSEMEIHDESIQEFEQPHDFGQDAVQNANADIAQTDFSEQQTSFTQPDGDTNSQVDNTQFSFDTSQLSFNNTQPNTTATPDGAASTDTPIPDAVVNDAPSADASPKEDDPQKSENNSTSAVDQTTSKSAQKTNTPEENGTSSNLSVDDQTEYSIAQGVKLPEFQSSQNTEADVAVTYAQEFNVNGASVSVPQWASDVLGIENNDPAVGAQPEISKTDKLVFDGKGPVEKIEGKLGWSGDLVRVEGVGVETSANKAEGSVNAYNANENIGTRFFNKAGNILGDYVGGSVGARANVDLTWDFGVKGTFTPSKGEVKAVAGLQPELNANASLEQRLDVKNIPFASDTTLQAKQQLFAEGKGAVGVVAKATTDTVPSLGYAEVGSEFGFQSTQSATPLQASDPGQPFANLNAAGEPATGETAGKIQNLFEVGSVDETSMVTVEVSNNNKVYEGPNNQDRATVYEWGGEGKYDQESNVVDKVLAGNYVRLEDQTRWLNEIGKQNIDNENKVFSEVTAQDLESLNPGKIKTIDIDGDQVKVISAENVNTGIIRNPDGSLERAQSVDLGDGNVVNLQ